MLVFPGMLVAAATEAGMKVPPDPDNFDSGQYPHFRVFCNMQLGRRMQPGEQWENAKVIAAVPEDEIRTITAADLIRRGLQCEEKYEILIVQDFINVLHLVDKFNVGLREDMMNGGSRRIERRRQPSGESLWTVSLGSHVARRDGTVEFEPQPSSRSDEYIARTRYSFNEACDIALKISCVDTDAVELLRRVVGPIANGNRKENP